MIRFWSVAMFLLTVVPMAVAAVGILRAARTVREAADVPPSRLKFRAVRGMSNPVLVVLLIAAAFLMNPHQDTYTGLDVAMYRQMAKAFAQGRGFDDVDRPFEQVPDEVKPLLLYRNVVTPGARQTRDCVFELVDYPQAATRPFFLPTLPLAAAGLDELGFSIDRFVPLLGVIWMVCVFLTCCAIHPALGGAAAFALLFGNLWTGWFLRGFHADAVGGALLAMAILVDQGMRPSVAGRLLLGLLLGLAISYHPTMAVLAAPAALAFAMRSGRVRDTAAMALGGIAGVLPLVFINLWVCQPYGDFFDANALAAMWRAVPEIRMVLAALALAAVLGGGVLTLAHVPKVRAVFEKPRARLAASVACAALCGIAALLPFVVGGPLREGFVETARIGWFWMAIAAAGAVCVFAMRRPLSERFLLAGLGLGALVFLYVKGVEVDVGLWSHRRLCAVVFCLISLMCIPLVEELRDFFRGRWNVIPSLAFTLLIVLFLLLQTTGQFALFATNDKFMSRMTDLDRRMKNDALVFYDYYPHSVPMQWDLDRSFFGLNEAVAKEQGHAPAMAWLADEAKRRSVEIISSYAAAPRSLVEDGLLLKSSGSYHWQIERFAPLGSLRVAPKPVPIDQACYNVAPIDESNRFDAVQTKILDGGPLGLRPPWGRKVKDGMWSLEGSGIVGTLPPLGEEVAITVKARWFPPNDGWSNQVLVVTPPFKGEPLEFTVPAGGEPVVCEGVIARPFEPEPNLALTGVYRIHAKTPYNPEEHGIRGFGEGLGAVIESIDIVPRPTGGRSEN